MRVDLQPDRPPTPELPSARSGRREPVALAVAAAALALLLAAAGVVGVLQAGDGDDGTGIRSAVGPQGPTVAVLGEVFTTSVPPTTTAAPAPVTGTAAGPKRSTVAASPGGGITPPTATSAHPTTVPHVATTLVPPPTTVARAASPTTTTAVDPCHHSSDPACGPVRFSPQPGQDNPMTAEVRVEPAAPVAGQQMRFVITLRDPDGVSYGSSLFGFGDSGIGDTSQDPCRRFGTWDPPPRDPAASTKVVEVPHTYSQPGTYQASFSFEPGPFDCVDSVTGRGDRPYASPAAQTVTVVVN